MKKNVVFLFFINEKILQNKETKIIKNNSRRWPVEY